MPGSSILPVSVYNNKLYFLFGKENPKEDSANGFSDFGGGIENGEHPLDTAIREGSEELTGFLGNPTQIRSHVKKNKYHRIVCKHESDPNKVYNMHIVYFPYDENLPTYYNNNHYFLWDRMDKTLLNDTKLFEKIKIEWFCEDDLWKRKREYRPFYKDMIKKLLHELPEVRKYAMKCHTKNCKNSGSSGGKTKKNKSRKTSGTRSSTKK